MITYNNTKLGKVEATKDEIKIGGQCAMDARYIASEIALVDLTLDALSSTKKASSFPLEILVGGLGMGVVHHRLGNYPFTTEPEVVTVELLPEMVEMHMTSLFYPFSKAVIPDSVIVSDFLEFDYGFSVNDVVLVDIDTNIPASRLKKMMESLVKGGVLGVWSAVPLEELEKYFIGKRTEYKKHVIPYTSQRDVFVYTIVNA